VLDAVRARLLPGGRVVATYATLERALGAADRLGHLVQVSVNRGGRLPDGSLRLVALDPVFVCWGPS
jgi:precorrin-6B methylase 2